MKTKKKNSGKKPSRKPKSKPKSKVVSNLGAAIKRGFDRTTGMDAPLVPYTGTSHEKLKAIMAGMIGLGHTEQAKTYSPEPAASAPGAYTRPVRW